MQLDQEEWTLISAAAKKIAEQFGEKKAYQQQLEAKQVPTQPGLLIDQVDFESDLRPAVKEYVENIYHQRILYCRSGRNQTAPRNCTLNSSTSSSSLHSIFHQNLLPRWPHCSSSRFCEALPHCFSPSDVFC